MVISNLLGTGVLRSPIQARGKSRGVCAGSPNLLPGATSLFLLAVWELERPDPQLGHYPYVPLDALVV